MARASRQKNRFKSHPPRGQSQVKRSGRAHSFELPFGLSGSYAYYENSGRISKHPVLSDSDPYAISCQCPVCRCDRPVEAQADGLSICGECRSRHY